MWLIIALLLEHCIGQRMIQTGLKDYFGEDAVLTEMLEARAAVPYDAIIELPDMPKEYYDNIRLFSIKKSDVYNITQNNNTNDTRRLLHEPPEVEQKKRVLEIIQHNIYITQYRMRHIQNITKKYASNVRYRLSTIFSRLDTLIKEMRTLYTYMNKTIPRIYGFWWWLIGSWEGRKRTVRMHLLYYTHILKRNIDVTYLVEHVIRKHTKYMEENYKLTTTTPSTHSGTSWTETSQAQGSSSDGDGLQESRRRNGPVSL